MQYNIECNTFTSQRIHLPCIYVYVHIHRYATKCIPVNIEMNTYRYNSGCTQVTVLTLKLGSGTKIDTNIYGYSNVKEAACQAIQILKQHKTHITCNYAIAKRLRLDIAPNSCFLTTCYNDLESL